MAESAPEYSIVDYYAEHERYRCGYCKSSNTNYSHGMWCFSLTVQDYQDLIDRGWRRSGRYCYKPTMNLTCCPMYTIRCLVTDLKLSKSQKKIIKRMNRYISYGDSKCKEDASGGSSVNPSEHPVEPHLVCMKSVTTEPNSEDAVISSVDPTLADTIAETSKHDSGSVNNAVKESSTAGDTSNVDESKRKVQPNKGNDVNLPPCKKAKVMRLERKKEKLMKEGLSEDDAVKAIAENKKPGNEAKSVEDFFADVITGETKYNLEIRLVRSSPPSGEYERTSQQTYDVYKKYQTTIHGDPPDECTMQQYTRFLVASPLREWNPSNGPSCGYGSFHQQYWLDGRLIAVGVLDILPKCISSVYFFYDPDFGHLSLGTYGSLRELCLTRSLQSYVPELTYYYMGYYIHTCPKMRYKAAYCPSFLLCPETYTWHPVEKCKPKLDVHRYYRFEEDPKVKDPDGKTVLSEVLVLYCNTAMPFAVYAATVREDAEEIHTTRKYANLVGMKCARKMLLLKRR